MLELRQTFIEEIHLNTLQPVYQSYENVINDQNEDSSEIKSTIYRYWDMKIPKIPRSIRLMAVTGQWALTLDHYRFWLKKDRNWGILMLVSEKQLNLLADCSILLSDGTFRSSPSFFSPVQNSRRDWRQFPLVWVLLKSKTSGVYRRMPQVLNIVANKK